jgi:sulfur-oxidizing protein SoxZ
MNTIRLKVRVKADYTEVKGLVKHVMETGVRRDEAGKLIPAHYIQEIKAYLNGELVWTALWGPAVSKDPYFSFRLAVGQLGDEIKVQWRDNKNLTGVAVVTL